MHLHEYYTVWIFDDICFEAYDMPGLKTITDIKT